ncbi:MAG: hypothetical protein WD554_07835 [Flavobacteriaceae bacterium]
METKNHKNEESSNVIMGVYIGGESLAICTLNTSMEHLNIPYKDYMSMAVKNNEIEIDKLSKAIEKEPYGIIIKNKIMEMERREIKRGVLMQEMNNIIAQRIINFAQRHNVHKINIGHSSCVWKEEEVMRKGGLLVISEIIERNTIKHGILVEMIDKVIDSPICHSCGD